MSQDISEPSSPATSTDRKPIGVVTDSRIFWLITPNWYMKFNERQTNPEAVVTVWHIYTRNSHTDFVYIYDETELLRWIIRGNPNK